MTQPRSDQTVFPTLRYADAPAAVEWLKSTLGFAQHAVYENEAGGIDHAQLGFGNDLIMLASATDDPDRPQTRGVSWTYLVDDRVDELHERATTSGADIVHALTDQEYGSREFTVRDPGGNLWTVGTYRPAEDPGS